MVTEPKLEPGWLTRDVNAAANRAKALVPRHSDYDSLDVTG